MPETVIELDLSSPWEPPEHPAPRRRLRARWVAVCAVLAVASGVLAAAGPRPRTGPLYMIDDRVRGVTVAGDKLIVERFQQSVTDPRIEGRRRSDGALLWAVQGSLEQHPVVAGAGALILVHYGIEDRGFSSTITVLDPDTGRQLWTRQNSAFVGSRDGLVVVQEMGAPEKVVDLPVGEERDPAVNHAADVPPLPLRVLDERTGTTVWEMTPPDGAVLDFRWDGRFPVGRVTGVDQLETSGLLTRRDIRTGAVRSTVQLRWSGRPAMFSTTAGWQVVPGRVPDRAVVYPDGQRGGIVFDLADGRSLFPTDVAIYDGLYPCAAGLYCSTTDRGLAAYDSTTGKPAWRLAGFTEIVASVGDRLVVSTYDYSSARPAPLGIADARTGALVTDLDGWRLIREASGERILVWRAADPVTGILGELDPVTGRVAVFGRAGEWYGPPECSAGRDTLACLMVGRMTVWQLPARRG
ncbi:hypothetical protein [Dactylosporangium sp. NPDC005555]|uniref:hypothetical protein n=1 Tax=Dactylosporangium sp. NPDC005555 TaxID=3154889 RepID=UPI0033A5073B